MSKGNIFTLWAKSGSSFVYLTHIKVSFYFLYYIMIVKREAPNNE